MFVCLFDSSASSDRLQSAYEGFTYVYSSEYSSRLRTGYIQSISFVTSSLIISIFLGQYFGRPSVSPS